MQIKVPISAINKGYDDSYLVFIHFMYKLMRKEGRDTHFYFFTKDVKKILGEMSDSAGSRMQKRLSPLFKVALINASTVRLTWDVDANKTATQGTAIAVEEVEIKEQRALNFYFYLLGRILDPTLITEKPVYYDGTEKHFKNLPNYTYKLFEV